MAQQGQQPPIPLGTISVANPQTGEQEYIIDGKRCTISGPSSSGQWLTLCIATGAPPQTVPSPPSGEPESPEPVGGELPTDPSDLDCHGKICDCIGPALESIGATEQAIKDLLVESLRSPCEKITGCMSSIIDEIKQRLKQPAKSCEQCKSDLENGLAGTIEYAVACAGQAVNNCSGTVQACSSQTEGQHCPNCGQQPCCCKSGECKPCEPQQPTPTKYIGYCNRVSGIIIALPQGQGPPSTDFFQVSIADTEQQALSTAVCIPVDRPPQTTPTVTPFPIFPTFGTTLCNIDAYTSEAGVRSFIRTDQSSDIVSAIQQSLGVIAEAAIEGTKLLPIVPGIIKGFAELEQAPFVLARLAGGSIASALGCGSKLWQAAYETLAGIGYLEKKIGVNLDEFKAPYSYAMHNLCRQKQLDPDKAIAAYLANSVDESTLDTLWGIHGFCSQSLRQYLYAARSKPLPMELAMMYRRSLIDKYQYDRGMRELGYLEQGVTNNLLQLTEQVPPMSDIIRFMVRDAGDDNIALKFGTDDEFEQKYTSQLKKWGDAQGIPKEVARYAWRSHWTIPSPQQLFEFWRRLRNNPKFGGKDKLFDDIKTALIQQDILPFWIPYFLEVSFHPLTRVDARRAFTLGALTKEQLRASFIDQGYSDDNAEILTTFSERQRDIAAVNNRAIKQWQKGLLTREEAYTQMVKEGLPNEVVNNAINAGEQGFLNVPVSQAFVHGDLTRSDFSNILSKLGVSEKGRERIIEALSYRRRSSMAIDDYAAGSTNRAESFGRAVSDGLSPEMAEVALQHTDDKIKNAFLVRCQQGIRKRYILGEFDRQSAINELAKRGTVIDRANMLVDNWDCEKSAIGRAQPASKLCNWLEMGAITAADFVKRLTQIGYTDYDAGLMLSDCLSSISVKRQKQAAKEIKDNQLADERAKREIERNEQKTMQLIAQSDRARDKAEQTRLRREKQLVSAAEKVAQHTGVSIADTLAAVRFAYGRLKGVHGLTADESLQSLLLSAEGKNYSTVQEYSDDVDAISGVSLTDDTLVEE